MLRNNWGNFLEMVPVSSKLVCCVMLNVCLNMLFVTPRVCYYLNLFSLQRGGRKKQKVSI